MPKSEQERAEIAGMISRLLSHYWTPDDDPAIRRAQMRDWIEDLSGFPLALVADACREWRRMQGRRPTPGDIYRLCEAEWRRLRERDETLRCVTYSEPVEPQEPPPTPEEKARIAALVKAATKRLLFGESDDEARRDLRLEAAE